MCNIARTKKQIQMITKRKSAIVRRRRQVPAGRPLYVWAEEKFKSDDYDLFLQFCKGIYSSLDERNMVSQGTFEHLVEEFEKREAMES